MFKKRAFAKAQVGCKEPTRNSNSGHLSGHMSEICSRLILDWVVLTNQSPSAKRYIWMQSGRGRPCPSRLLRGFLWAESSQEPKGARYPFKASHLEVFGGTQKCRMDLIAFRYSVGSDSHSPHSVSAATD